MLRRLLTILLCLGLALQGQAVRALDKSPCPMEATMQTMLAAGDLDPADLPDCCNDLQTFAETGHLCKTGSDCGAPPVLAPMPRAELGVAAAPPIAPQGRAMAALAASTATPWRPPARV